MKTLLTIFLVFFLISFKIVDKTVNRNSKWIITENSSLIVNGSTNINKFSCGILRYTNNDTVILSNDKTGNILLSGAIHIELKNFDCRNSIMTKELRKTLNEKEFPILHIRFISLKEISGSRLNTKAIRGTVEIEIAGKAKRFEIDYQLAVNKNKMTLTGIQAINFSDFNLQPPKKMGKLIKAKDELQVVLDLKMELI